VSHGKFEFELLEIRRFLSGGGGYGDLPDWIEVQDSPSVLAGHGGHVDASFGRFEWNLPSADQYAVTIDWGDGSESAGKVIGNVDGSFSIVGAHDYADDTHYVALAVVQAADGTRGAGGAFVAAYADPIDLADSYDLYYGDGWYGPPDNPFRLGHIWNDFSLGLFYDADHTGSDPTSYHLTIDWGDGTNPTSTDFTTSAGAFYDNVPVPYHFYPKNGDYPINFSVMRDDVIIRSSATAHVWWTFEFVPIDESGADAPTSPLADPVHQEPFAGATEPTATQTIAAQVLGEDRSSDVLESTEAPVV
jgi:hypothetical protein